MSEVGTSKRARAGQMGLMSLGAAVFGTATLLAIHHFGSSVLVPAAATAVIVALLARRAATERIRDFCYGSAIGATASVINLRESLLEFALGIALIMIVVGIVYPAPAARARRRGTS